MQLILMASDLQPIALDSHAACQARQRDMSGSVSGGSQAAKGFFVRMLTLWLQLSRMSTSKLQLHGPEEAPFTAGKRNADSRLTQAS